MKNKFLFFLLFFTVSFFNSFIQSQQLAFPGAEGFGRYAKGARAVSSPTVYHVTNLNDSGTGSLRDAVSESGRIVVFDVCGVINLKSRLAFSSNCYVAGQSAPGDGIILYGNGVTFSAASNIIVRYLRVHMGKENGDAGKDAAGIANGANMIFDHMSVTWGLDENFSVNWDSKGTEPGNITIQNSIIGQGIMSHSAGGLIQTDGGVSILGCLYIDNKTRNPKVKGLNQFINNVVYNWDGSTGYILGGTDADSWAWLQGNYFIGGPCSGSTPFSRATTSFQLYQTNNYVDVDQDGTLNGSEATNSDFGSAGFVSDTSSFSSRPQAHPDIAGGILSPQAALSKVIDSVGASLPARSAVDAYMINQLVSYGTEGAHIVHEKNDSIYNYVGVVSEGDKPTDSDSDGIPDDWEDANNLDKADASDAVETASNGYLNIENYLNSINAPVSDYVRCASNIRMTDRTKASISLSWTNNATESDNILVQQSTDGSTFSTIATIAGTSSSYTASSLAEETTYYYRLITTKSGLDNSTPSEIYSVATEGEAKIPYVSTDPTPSIGDTTRFYTSVDFAWENATGPWAGTVYYSVYFGSSADNLTKIADSLTDLEYTFDVDSLTMYTKYYWRVDASNTLGTTAGTVWDFITGSYSFTSTVADIGVDYDGSTATTATSGVTLSTSKTYTLNSEETNEFIFSASGSSVMNTTSSRGVYDASNNYSFFYLSSNSYYVQGSVTSNSEEQEISDLKINGTSANLDDGAVCYVLYSDEVGFSTTSIIGYEEVELPAVRSGGSGVELSLPTDVKSFRIYQSVTISTIGEDLYQIGSGTNTETLTGSGSPRIAYLSATMELTSDDDTAPSSDNTIESATVNGKTATVDNTNKTIICELISGTTLGAFPVTYSLTDANATCDFTSGSSHDFSTGSLQMVVTAEDGSQATYTVSVSLVDMPSMSMYFPFDEGSGSTATDSVGNYVATANNFTPTWESHNSGSSIVFPGTPANSYMSIPYESFMNFGSSAFSISLWFKSDGSNTDSYFFHKGTHSTTMTNGTGKWTGLQYQNSSTERLTFAVDDNSTKTALDITSDLSNYFNNAWHHVVCIRDVDNDLLKVYLDGELAGSKADGTGDIGETADFILGNANVNFDAPYVGNLDDFRVYLTALSESEVEALYQDGITSSIHSSTEDNAEISVYPTIFDNELTITAVSMDETYGIQLYSITGTLVYQQLNIPAGTETVKVENLGSLSKGVYLCRIASKSQQFIKKVVK